MKEKCVVCNEEHDIKDMVNFEGEWQCKKCYDFFIRFMEGRLTDEKLKS